MRLASFLILTALLSAQQPPVPLSEIASQSNRLQLLLQQLQPERWAASGDSHSYRSILDTALKDNRAVIASAQALSNTPDRIVESLSLLEQLHSVQESVSQLATGVAKYQNPALAELLTGMQNEGRAARNAYRDHVVELVSDREQQFQVADHEAQRCRALLSKDPNAARRAVKSK